jgi:pre-mRNA-processing factor 40
LLFLQIVFEDLLDRAKEKEEKEAKKRKRIIDDFNELLHSEKVGSTMY